MLRVFIRVVILAQLMTMLWFSGVLASYPATAAKTLGITLYPDRAMVKKSLHISIDKGESVVELTGFTPSLIDNSVQVGIKDGGRTRIADIEVRRTALVKPEQDPAKQLQDRIGKINEELRRQENAMTITKNSLDFLQKIVPFAKNQNTSFKTVNDYLVAQERAATDRFARIAEIEKTIIELKKKKTDLERELETIGPERKESKSLLIKVYADAPMACDLEYSYFLTHVTWTPKYEVRADSVAQRLELNFFAIIRQASGEDLSGSGIEISTARPNVSGALPELIPWRLDIYTPPIYRGYGRAKGLVPMAEAPMPMEPAAEMEAMAEPEIINEATSMSYKMPQKITLPSDNQPHKILVSNSGCDAKFEYLAVPRLAQFATLTAELKNPFTFPLLDGEMNVFLDGRFVSTSRIEKPVSIGEEMRLPLGLDETIYVTSKLQKQFTEEVGAFSKQIHKQYEYQTEIVNGKSRPIALVVRDHVPISAHEDIKVELEAPAPGEAKIGDDGIIIWNLDLAPGEKRQLSVRFDVKYPKGKEITGL